MRNLVGKWLTRAPSRGVEHDLPASGEVAAPPSDPALDAEAEALWREARDEPSPFRRDALFMQAANALIGSAGPDLVRYCFKHTQDLDVADDIAQRACLVLWQSLARFEARSRLRTYLFGIAFNLCRRHARESTREARKRDHFERHLRFEMDPEMVSLEREAGDRHRLAVLDAALRELGERDAWLLRERLTHERSYAEILPLYQARFGHHVTTVEGLRTAFFHARRRLETRLRLSDRQESR